jgi:hypothetical protein
MRNVAATFPNDTELALANPLPRTSTLVPSAPQVGEIEITRSASICAPALTRHNINAKMYLSFPIRK